MFYELDSTRVTLREYRWGTPWGLMPFAVFVKLLRIRIRGSSDDPNVESLEPFRVPREGLPAEVLDQFQPLETQLQALGFVDPVYHFIEDPFSQTRICQATFHCNSGKALARIHYRRWSQPSRTREYLFPMFVSGFADGTFLVSSAGKPDLLPPPCCQSNWVVGATVADLWKSHTDQLSLASFGKSPLLAYSQDETVDLIERHHAAVRDFHVERGVFRRRTDATPELVRAAEADSEVPLDPDLKATLAEIERVQSHKASGAGSLLILALTVAAFFAAGPMGFDWQWLLLLVGVLFFHELGHLSAMWLFRYRNLRMFFIPFFGAAATGQNYNVPGWKRATVSLMGPFPGVVLGMTLGIIALVSGNPPLLRAAVMLLAINAFNLLPIVPLDGGWMMHSVLFSRHPVLDVAFRAVAAVLLILLGSVGGKFLVFLGVVMLMGLRPSYRVAQVVRRLRANGLDAASPDAQTIPLPTAIAIVRELRTALPANAGPKNMARQTIQVFESLNARPPGWLVSLAFIGLHTGTLLVAFAACMVFLVGMHPGHRAVIMRGGNEQRHPMDPQQVLSWQGPDAAEAARGSMATIVADFDSRADAEEAYRGMTGRMPRRMVATLFGQTVLVSLPAGDVVARKQWAEELERNWGNVLSGSRQSGTPLTLRCLARNVEEAQRIAEEANQYLQIRWDMYPVPPWSKEHSIAPVQRSARRTYVEIQRRFRHCHEDPRIKALGEEIGKAETRDDERAIEQLSQKKAGLLRELEMECLSKLREEGATKWDVELLSLYTQKPHGQAEEDERFAESEQEWALAVGRRLGQLPLKGGRPVDGSDRFGSRSGSVSQTGLLIRFRWLVLDRATDGAPALAVWLGGKGAHDLQYEFHSGRKLEN